MLSQEWDEPGERRKPKPEDKNQNEQSLEDTVRERSQPPYKTISFGLIPYAIAV